MTLFSLRAFAPVSFQSIALVGALSVTLMVAGPVSAEEVYDYLDIDPAQFSNPTVIDNRWWPLTPGILRAS